MWKIIKVLRLLRALGGAERGKQKAKLSRFQTPSQRLLDSHGILILSAFLAAGIKEQKSWAEVWGLQGPCPAGAGPREGALGWGGQQDTAALSQNPCSIIRWSLAHQLCSHGCLSAGESDGKAQLKCDMALTAPENCCKNKEGTRKISCFRCFAKSCISWGNMTVLCRCNVRLCSRQRVLYEEKCLRDTNL